MTHLAVDLALGTTGVCWGDGPHDHDSFTTRKTMRGGERLAYIRDCVEEHLRPHTTTIVSEAPLMSRRHPTGAIPLIKLHGVIEHLAWRLGLTYIEAAHPSVIKKHATGRGNATKDDMIAAARALGYHPDNDNEADAIHIWRWWNQQGQP